MIYITYYNSPLGKLSLISDGENLNGLYFEKQNTYFYKKKIQLICCDDLKIFKKTKSWLTAYFSGKEVNINDLNLKLEGTIFQKEVWKLLYDIPYGKTTTYKELSEKVAIKLKKEKMSAQAVGGAISKNPISIIIPCHRVVGVNNNLIGYAGGIDKKIKLLQIEGHNINNFFYS